MRDFLPLLLLAGLAVGARASQANIPSSLFMFKDLTMNVLEPGPTERPSQTSGLESSSIDGSKLNSTQLSDAIVDLVASEMRKAGLSTDDLKKFVENVTNAQNMGDQQNVNVPKPSDNSDMTVDENGQPADKTSTGDFHNKNANDDSGLAVDDQEDDEKDDRMGSPRYPKLLDSANPSGNAGDVFNNGTDFFKWLNDIIEQVEDRMSKIGNTADPTAQNERPGQMDGKATRDNAQQPETPQQPAEFNRDRSSDMSNQPSAPSKNWNSYNADGSNRNSLPSKSDGSMRLAWNKRKSNQVGETSEPSDADNRSPRPSGATDVNGWRKSEEDHGGFDNIPKAVPMIVMSGNTYIKDIGNFRNIYEYSGLPVNIRTIEPNGNDSGLDLDYSSPENEKSEETYNQKKIVGAKRDGNTRKVDRLLGMVAQFIKIHGHDDGEAGDGATDDAQQPRHNTNRRDDAARRHDDGGRRPSGPRQDPRHDDGNTYHSSVHGHDDGDDSRPRSLLRSPAGQPDNVHGHDDGNTYKGDVHGHDDQGSERRTGGSGGGSGSSGDWHGHDDGQTYNGDSSRYLDYGTDYPVGGGGGGSSAGDWYGGSGTDSSDDSRSTRVHGHDDGNTYNPADHGHDDGSGSRARAGPLRLARRHDDGNTHGHDSSSSEPGKSVHGHDDGNTHGHDSSSSEPGKSVHGHDDGNTHGHDSSSSEPGKSVHGHDDGNMRASQPVGMRMMNISLTVIGCAFAAIVVSLVAVARRRRVGVFRRQDYLEV